MALFRAKGFHRVDANGATGWTGESEDADENHERGRSRDNAGDEQAADILHLIRVMNRPQRPSRRSRGGERALYRAQP
jgi:hypothetical protein